MTSRQFIQSKKTLNPDKLNQDDPRYRQLHALLDELDEIKYIDNERLLALARETQPIATSLHDLEAWAQATNYEAWGLCILGDNEQSTEKALLTLQIAQQQNFPAIEAQALNILASVFYSVSDYETFRQLLEYQYAIAREFNLPDIEQMALHDLGVYYARVGDADKGIQYLQKCLEIDDVTRHRGVIRGIAHLNLGNGYRVQEQYKPAIKHLKQALEILRRAGSDYYLQPVYTYLTEIYLDLEEEALASSYAQQATEIANRLTIPLLKIEALHNSATLLKYQQRFAEAEVALQTALALARQHHLLGPENTTYGYLSALHTQMGSPEKVAHDEMEQQRVTNTSVSEALNQHLEILLRVYQSGQKTYRQRKQQIMDESGEYPSINPEHALKGTPAEERAFASSKRAVMQRLAHEFRTPLAVIRSGTELLARYHDRMSEEQRQSKLENITDRVDWMTTMLDDILLLLQLNRAERQSQPQIIDLHQIIHQSLDDIAHWVDDPERVSVHFDNPTRSVKLDPEFLRKIITHLLSNALKFSQESVSFTVKLDDSSLYLLIEDRGIGIPPDELEQVREVFYRASNLNEVPGMGIGLSIVDQAVASCGGQWLLKSKLNEGTTAEVTLPISEA